jgi:hypothetical protein
MKQINFITVINVPAGINNHSAQVLSFLLIVAFAIDIAFESIDSSEKSSPPIIENPNTFFKKEDKKEPKEKKAKKEPKEKKAKKEGGESKEG